MTNSGQNIDPKLVIVKEPPEWMRGKAEGFSEYLAAVEPKIIEVIAEFGEKFPSDGSMDPANADKAYLHQLIMAAFFPEARSLYEWREYAQSYPNQALTEEEVGTAQNPNVQVRAQFLRLALSRLLELIAAPPAMLQDAQKILGLHAPAGATVRAAAQAEWCNDPQTNLRAIARKLECDHGQLYKDRDRGLLRRPSVDYVPTPKAKKKAKRSG